MTELCSVAVIGALILAVIGLFIRVSQGATYILRLEAELQHLRELAANDAAVAARIKVVVRIRFTLLTAIIKKADQLIDTIEKTPGVEPTVIEAIKAHKLFNATQSLNTMLDRLADEDIFAGMIVDELTGERAGERR